MLTCKVCVNNSCIANVCIVNVSKDYSKTGEQEYRYQIHRPGKLVKEGEVKHYSENGALGLIANVILDEKEAEDVVRTNLN